MPPRKVKMISRTTLLGMQNSQVKIQSSAKVKNVSMVALLKQNIIFKNREKCMQTRREQLLIN